MVRTLVAVVLLAASTPIACADDGGGDTQDATTDGGTGTTAASTTAASTTAATDGSSTAPTTGEAGPSFAVDVFPLFAQACSCHTMMIGQPTTFFMGSDAATAHAAMVDKPSSQSALDFVEPGDSASSYLYHKLAGTYPSVGGGGDPMPLGGKFGDAELATVAAWIDAGAAP